TVEPSPAKGAEHGRDYTSAEWWLVYITGALVLATSGLIIYTARLWGATKSLAEDAKNTATQQALDTQTSLRISRESADAAKKSVELAREEFLSTHRPRIILRDAFCRDNEIDHPIVVTYTLVNIGETRGRIVMWGADIQLNTGGDLLPYQLPSMYKHDSGFLDPGEERQDAHYSIRQWRTDDQSRHAFVEDSLGVFFCGHLIYEDDRMVRRHMAFWRKYDFSTSRFYIVSHHTLKALEYAD
ncbi:MAG TPA: hypothetical protein VN638_00300, partial [Nitrospiraceae bacterium]|nr:hypothetical protein [Nitrospiraceae bacterium]